MHSSKIAELSNSSKNLVEKWNAKYFSELFIFFKEQIDVLEGVRVNTLQFISSNKEQISKGTGDSLAIEPYSLHTKNLVQLKLLYSQLKTKAEIRDFVINLKTAFQNNVQSIEHEIVDEFNRNLPYAEKGTGSYPFLRKIGGFRYYLSSAPGKFRNFFLLLLNKPVKPIKPRYHRIYYQCIVKGFLLKEYISCLQITTFEIQKQLIQYAHSIFELESSLIDSNYQFYDDSKELLIQPDLNVLLKDVVNFYEGYENRFLFLLEKSGTLELPLLYIRFKSNRNVKNIVSLIDLGYRSWHCTFFAFYEDWRFREELFGFIANLKVLAEKASINYVTKLRKTLNPIITTKREYIEQLIERIPNPENSDLITLKHFFTSELYALKKQIRSQTEETDFSKTSSEVRNIFQKIEFDVTRILEKFPQKSGVVRSPNYEKGIRRTEISFFSPAEFIQFEYIPSFLAKIALISDDFAANFETVVHELSDFDQITDFSIDTAVSMINAQSTAEQVVLMFREGMKRSLNILESTAVLSNETLYAKEIDITHVFQHFVGNVQTLEDNDSILSIYSRLLKSKTIQDSKDKRRKLVGVISAFFPFIASFVKEQTNNVLGLYKEIRKRLKLDKASVFVSSAISNYLAEINKRIYNLPVIYRYLFENAPVKEVNLFLSRQQEIVTLNTALKDWKLGNYAATLVIGENGSGKSSLLQHYLKTVKDGVKIFYLVINRFYHSESDFYELMQDVFENKDLLREQDVLDQIASLKGQQIIVIDGLERVFVRKPGGFDCLRKLLSIIISTNNQAFWICSVSLHAANYLNKTISLKENFDYLVELSNLSSDEMRNIVLKRHRLSGYIVIYEDDTKQPEQNSKIRERQNQLEAEFFFNLNKFAHSNISLSLYFWLESISEFTEKELYIKQFSTPDFSFLETLTPEKAYTLLLIVMHGRITIDWHSIICNVSKERSKWVLSVLKEDSILLLKGNYYILNGILYRHVVQLLKNRNLIH